MTAYLVLRDHPLQARPGRPDDHAHRRRCRRHRPPGRTGRVRCARHGRRAVDRTAGAAGTAAAFGEQHRRGSGAMGRRLGKPVRGPDERHRTVAGHDPHPLHRPERLRRRNRLYCRRAGAHRRSGHAPAGVREHRRDTERNASGRRHGATTPTHCSATTGLSASRPARTVPPAAASPSERSAGSTASGRRSPGSSWGSQATTRVEAALAAADAMVDRIAGDSRRQVRAMPDPRQRALAPGAALRSHRSRLQLPVPPPVVAPATAPPPLTRRR